MKIQVCNVCGRQMYGYDYEGEIKVLMPSNQYECILINGTPTHLSQLKTTVEEMKICCKCKNNLANVIEIMGYGDIDFSKWTKKAKEKMFEKFKETKI